MNPNILKRLLFSTAMSLIILSCSKDEEPATCVLQKFGIAPDSHWLFEFNENGTIASATSVFSGVENQRYDYIYSTNTLSIYLTDLAVSDQLVCVMGLDTQGRPVSRSEYGKMYEKMIYNGDKLDHVMFETTKDSLVYRYGDTGINPIALDFYAYHASNQTWTHHNTTSFTYDQKQNPLKGFILPPAYWNSHAFQSENNLTSYASDGGTWHLDYTYNSEGYPISRTLTSSSQNFSETIDLEYRCE